MMINSLIIRQLLPVLIVLQLFVSHRLSFAQIISGACKENCDKARPNGIKQSFKFYCDNIYNYKSDDNSKCHDSCEHCPKEVCDESTSNNIFSPSTNAWHCPSTELQGQCLQHCNKHRPKGWRQNYTLSCDTAYSTDLERSNCKDQCSQCPSFVCQKNEPHLFHCPDEKFEGECKKQCDKARVYGELGPLSFKCDGKYSLVSKQMDCQNTCRNHCPSWVCDGVDVNSYDCPTLRIEEKCDEFCKTQRRNYGRENFTFKCDDGYQAKCKEGCEKCNFGNGDGPLCDSSYKKDFLCPALEPYDEPLRTLKSYKGACQDYCELNRGEGFHAYVLDCDKRYTTNEEKKHCKSICANCSGDDALACDSGGTILACRGIKSKLEIERNKTEEERMEEMKRKDKRNEQLSKINAVQQDEREMINNFVILLIVMILLITAGFFGILWYVNKVSYEKLMRVQPEAQQQVLTQPETDENENEAGGLSTIGQQGNGSPQQQEPGLAQTQLKQEPPK